MSNPRRFSKQENRTLADLSEKKQLENLNASPYCWLSKDTSSVHVSLVVSSIKALLEAFYQPFFSFRVEHKFGRGAGWGRKPVDIRRGAAKWTVKSLDCY